MSDGDDMIGQEREVKSRSTSGALTRENVENHCNMLADANVDWPGRESLSEALLAHDAALRATIEQQAQELERVKQDVEKYKALLLQSYRDNIEDFKVQCKPKCDSYGHEDDCPAVYPGLVYDEMRQQLAARERERDEKSLEIIKLRQEVWGCIGQRDELHKVCTYHEKLEAGMLEKLTAREETIRALEARWAPIEDAARNTFELESLPILLNGGTRGQERLAQIIARWHTAESLCVKLQATLTARGQVKALSPSSNSPEF